MAETQSTVETQNTVETPSTGAEGAKAKAARVEQKAKEMVDAVLEASVTFAGLSLGVGRKTLATSARALDRAADKLGELECKLKKAPEATEKPAEPAASANEAGQASETKSS